MVELIQLVDESLARHGLGALLQGRHLPATQDHGDPNWANAQGDRSEDRISVVMGQSAVVRVANE